MCCRNKKKMLQLHLSDPFIIMQMHHANQWKKIIKLSTTKNGKKRLKSWSRTVEKKSDCEKKKCKKNDRKFIKSECETSTSDKIAFGPGLKDIFWARGALKIWKFSSTYFYRNKKKYFCQTSVNWNENVEMKIKVWFSREVMNIRDKNNWTTHQLLPTFNPKFNLDFRPQPCIKFMNFPIGSEHKLIFRYC